MFIPKEDEFLAALKAYDVNERRGPVYFSALEQLSAGWTQPAEMAEAIGVLLRSWHWNFYRFGMYDPARLEDCIENELPALTKLRSRTIENFTSEDEPLISRLFGSFTVALRGINRKGESSSQTSTAKALHLLAPGFLPLWDDSIAIAYGQGLMLAPQYIAFTYQMKDFAEGVRGFVPVHDDRSILKRIDEFAYAVYTKHWV